MILKVVQFRTSKYKDVGCINMKLLKEVNKIFVDPRMVTAMHYPNINQLMHLIKIKFSYLKKNFWIFI